MTPVTKKQTPWLLGLLVMVIVCCCCGCIALAGLAFFTNLLAGLGNGLGF
jgi:hypothetical protein